MPDKASYVHYHWSTKKHRTHPSYYPVLSNVQATPQGLISWLSDIPSTSQVLYGTTPLLGLSSLYDSTLVTSHSIQLSGLIQGILYYFRVQSFFLDSLSISDLYTFLYNPITGDILMEDGINYILLEDGTKIAVESNP